MIDVELALSVAVGVVIAKMFLNVLVGLSKQAIEALERLESRLMTRKKKA